MIAYFWIFSCFHSIDSLEGVSWWPQRPGRIWWSKERLTTGIRFNCRCIWVEDLVRVWNCHHQVVALQRTETVTEVEDGLTIDDRDKRSDRIIWVKTTSTQWHQGWPRWCCWRHLCFHTGPTPSNSDLCQIHQQMVVRNLSRIWVSLRIAIQLTKFKEQNRKEKKRTECDQTFIFVSIKIVLKKTSLLISSHLFKQSWIISKH
jgi:hypothetical protein